MPGHSAPSLPSKTHYTFKKFLFSCLTLSHVHLESAFLTVSLPVYLSISLSSSRHITLRLCVSRGRPGFQTLTPTSAPWPLLLHYQRQWRARRRRLMYPFPPPFRTRQPSELPECSLIGIECPFKLLSSHQGGGRGGVEGEEEGERKREGEEYWEILGKGV